MQIDAIQPSASRFFTPRPSAEGDIELAALPTYHAATELVLPRYTVRTAECLTRSFNSKAPIEPQRPFSERWQTHTDPNACARLIQRSANALRRVWAPLHGSAPAAVQLVASAALFAATYSTLGAISGGLGNALLHSTTPGGHSRLAAEHAALGGGVLGAGLGALGYGLTKLGPRNAPYGLFFVAMVGCAVVAGAPGAAILHASRGTDALSVRQSTASSAVGSLGSFPVVLLAVGGLGALLLRPKTAESSNLSST